MVGLWTAQLGYKIVTGRIRHERGGGGKQGMAISFRGRVYLICTGGCNTGGCNTGGLQPPPFPARYDPSKQLIGPKLQILVH